MDTPAILRQTWSNSIRLSRGLKIRPNALKNSRMSLSNYAKPFFENEPSVRFLNLITDGVLLIAYCAANISQELARA